MTRELIAAVARRPGHMRILRRVAALGLPDCWVGAGFVRNAVWDDLHGHEKPTPFVDVDVVYFDLRTPTSRADEHYRAKLMTAEPDIPWSVKNQARMHLRNQDTPYGSTAEALRHWPETCTAVAVRLRDGGVEVLAPFGLQDLSPWSFAQRPIPSRSWTSIARAFQRSGGSYAGPSCALTAPHDRSAPTQVSARKALAG